MRGGRGGKRAKTERGTAHHHERNPTSYPRRRSCLSVYSSVYSRGRRPQSIDFTPRPSLCPSATPRATVPRPFAPPSPRLQHFPTSTESRLWVHQHRDISQWSSLLGARRPKFRGKNVFRRECNLFIPLLLL
ncbi:hypothetical protein PUN28_016757 [Cardiocondyla obscurior]|uniref:Uncharacterized protein n=1 Tax=Cardiocondyla obscurior TaxID=286306 RepID=A0AAW2EQA1_9HYME